MYDKTVVTAILRLDFASAFSLVDKIASRPYVQYNTMKGFDSGSFVGCVIHGGVLDVGVNRVDSWRGKKDV